jgi:phosphoribosylaminoimidazolecarboxamide formyltransferase / IMP cyclohydrolase
MSPNQYPIKRALISVSDKTGIIEFASSLSEMGIELISTGGTHKTLTDAGLSVKGISEVTGFPEIMNGRVKTLHPGVHAGLLADLGKDEHIKQMDEQGFSSIDMLVVNLYPFEETLKRNADHSMMIENIDIGGPAMLRAAAKNYKWTAVVTSPEKYDEIIAQMRENNNTISEDYRKNLARETFSLTSFYDSVIANYFNSELNIDYPEKLNLGFRKASELRYGENPAQSASLYGDFFEIYEKLHGKELSYNNIVDIDAACKLVIEFEESPACAIIKHTNPAGVGLGKTLDEAYHKAFATDNVSPFGGIFAFNRTLDLKTAETIHKIFSEVIIAPDYEPEALNLLMHKRDRRLIKMDVGKLQSAMKIDYKSVSGGMLAQDHDKELLDKDALRVATDLQPTDEQWKALMFAWRVAKHVKSNAIIYTSSNRTLGVGAGQMSRVDSARIAASKAKEMGLDLKDCAVASDAFFPFADGLLQCVEAGASCVIQPGGSVRDEEVIRAADENNIAMVFTGMRHFKH